MDSTISRSFSLLVAACAALFMAAAARDSAFAVHMLIFAGAGILAAFATALKLDPQYAPAHAQRGMIYLATGDNDRARTDFRDALSSEPTNEIATAGLSRLDGSQ